MDSRHGTRKEITLTSVRATKATQVAILGQTGRVLEYHPAVDPQATWTQDADGLHLSVMRAQRLYNNRQWPNPVVIKLTHVQPVE